MGYCKKHDAYNGNGTCNYCTSLMKVAGCVWRTTRGGSSHVGYWECTRKDHTDKDCPCYAPPAAGNIGCANLYKDECTFLGSNAEAALEAGNE